MVLKRVAHIAPCTQLSPRWKSIEVLRPAFQAAVQAAMPERTPAGLLKASVWMAAAGRATFARPISLLRGRALGSPTVDSTKAIELDVPSSTAAIVLVCCQANSPVVGTLELFVFAVVPPPRMFVVVPTHPK